MPTITDTQVQQTLDYLLNNRPVSTLFATLQAENDKLLLWQEFAKNPPHIAPISTTNWELVSDWIFDGQGPNNISTLVNVAYNYAIVGAQVKFFFVLGILFKTLMRQYSGSLTLLSFTPLSDISGGSGGTPGISALFFPSTGFTNGVGGTPVVGVT